MARMSEYQVALEVGFAPTLEGAQLTVEGGLLQTLVLEVSVQITSVFVALTTQCTERPATVHQRS